MLRAGRSLLVAGRVFGLAPLRLGRTARSVHPSFWWGLYSWSLACVLAAFMVAALYLNAPGKSRLESSPSSRLLFRADIFVFAVACLNDSIAIALLVLANVKARDASFALNKLIACEAASKSLSGRGWARWVRAQVCVVVLSLVAYTLVASVFLVTSDADSSDTDASEDEDPIAEAFGLAHFPSLPLQLISCLLFGDQVCMIWLQVRALNRQMRDMFRGTISTVQPRLPPGFPLLPTADGRPPQQWARCRVPLRASIITLTASPAVKLGTEDRVHHIHQNFQKLQALHSEIRHALSLLSSAHGLEMMLMILITFSGATTSLYMRLTSKDEGSALAMAWSALVTLFLFGVLTAGELVKRESRCTMEQTHRLLVHHELDPVLRREVRGFSQRILHQSLRVSAYGFLPLDYSMLQGMVGSVTTYLIMVIQLSPEPGAEPALELGVRAVRNSTRTAS